MPRHHHRHRPHLALVAAVFATIPACLLPAATRYFVGTNNSLFSVSTNWSAYPGGPIGFPPVNNDNATVSPSTPTTVNLDATPNGVSLGTLSLTPSGSASLLIKQTAASLSVASFLFGPRVTFNHLGGNATSTDILTIDALTASYNLSAGTLTASGLSLGATAAGTFTQSNGTASFTGTNGTLRVGGQGPARVTLAGGTLNDSCALLDSYISASFSQSGGVHNVSTPGLLLGQNASYSLSAGSLNLAGPFYVGGKAAYPTGTPAITTDVGATFSQTGGDVTLSSSSPLTIDANPGSSALYSLSAGSVSYPSTKRDITIGLARAGTFVQTGGTINSSRTYLAKDIGSSASFSLSNAAQFSMGTFYGGYSGSAEIAQSGGTLSAGSFYLGMNAGSSASYTISGGLLKASVIYAPYSGSATITQTGGTVSRTGTTLFAYSPGSTAFYTLSGTGYISGLETCVGISGSATFIQSGGTHSAGALGIATVSTSTSSYTLSAGTLLATTMQVSGNGGRGTFSQTGGSVSLDLSGSYCLMLDPAGSLNLAGGTFSCIPAADVIINGPLTHTGGTFSAPNSNLRLGTTTSSAASYSLSNTASFTAKTLTVGETGPATFAQSGGSAFVTSLSISSTGSYTLSAGTLLIDYPATSPAAQLRSYLSTGRLTTSPSVPQNSRIAYVEAASLTPSARSAIAGQDVDTTTIIIKIALTGDANLDGRINADDYALLDRAYAKSLPNALWTDGDFNYDGTITSADYLLLDTAFCQAQGFSPGFLSLRESQFGATYVSQLLTSIPEPSLLTACGLALLPLTRRRPRT